jgi:hypothetical protein
MSGLLWSRMPKASHSAASSEHELNARTAMSLAANSGSVKINNSELAVVVGTRHRSSLRQGDSQSREAAAEGKSQRAACARNLACMGQLFTLVVDLAAAAAVHLASDRSISLQANHAHSNARIFRCVSTASSMLAQHLQHDFVISSHSCFPCVAHLPHYPDCQRCPTSKHSRDMRVR